MILGIIPRRFVQEVLSGNTKRVKLDGDVIVHKQLSIQKGDFVEHIPFVIICEFGFDGHCVVIVLFNIVDCLDPTGNECPPANKNEM